MAVPPPPNERSEQHWVDQWEKGLTPWHRKEPDSQLQSHINLLTGGKHGLSIFIPFCGKSLDIIWLLKQGHSVVGVELSSLAVQQLFEENELPYSKIEEESFTVYKGLDQRLKIFVGSLFDLTAELTDHHDAVWDCKALGAVNISQRKHYIKILLSILKPSGSILVSHLEYDSLEHYGPPFSLSTTVLQALFDDEWSVECVECVDLTETAVAKEHRLSWTNGLLHHVHRQGTNIS